MNKLYSFFLRSVLVTSMLYLPQMASAQLPQCINAGWIYFHQNPSASTTGGPSNIYNYNILQPLSATNPVLNAIQLPTSANGLAVNNNINGPGPSPTFYMTNGGNYWYHNGTAWVNTGHSVGNAAAVNPAGSGSIIYNLVGGTGQIYRYDGTGPGTLLVTIADFQAGGPYDLHCDCEGNFYILKVLTNGGGPPYMRKYSPTGALLQSWTLANIPAVSGTWGGAFYFLGNTVVWSNSPTTFVLGTISGSVVTFAPPSPAPVPQLVLDGAGCAECGIIASIDTAYQCPGAPGIAVSVAGAGPYQWSLLSGNATITPNTGANVVINATTTSRIQVMSTSTLLKDTVTVVVPTATIDAGPDDTLRGCGIYVDTIYGQLSNTLSWLPYNIQWTPAANITAGATTLTPIVSVTSSPTSFYLTVSTAATQGGCTWRDTTVRWTKDVSVDAQYSYIQRWGCEEDTLLLTNQSVNLDSAGVNTTMFYAWEFGDNTGDTAKNPVHIYPNQSTYTVKLTASNGICKDSITKFIDFNHPLDASFTVDDDSLCQNQVVNFSSTSVTTTKNGIDPTYTWDFGDGSPLVSGIAQTTSHFYSRSGIYTAKLWVRDFVPCTDTAYKIIVVDSVPYIRLVVGKDTACEGEGIPMFADYLHIGDIGLAWDFGDGTKLFDNNPLTHAYDSAGAYIVTIKASYRQCRDTMTDTTIIIKPYPMLNLGADTALCVGGAPIRIGDLSAPAGRYRWNTGDTTATILARNYGTYYATISLDGCASTDTIEVRKDCYLDIPNVFTPDGDGLNDYFLPRVFLSRSLTRFKMTVFNRWGQIIFESANINGRGWDGKFNDIMQPQGVYVYRIEAEFENGGKESYTGNVTLLR